MYSCERRGDNVFEFKLTAADGGSRGGGGGGLFARSGVLLAVGALLLLQALLGGRLGLQAVAACLVLAGSLWSLSGRFRVYEESLLVVQEMGVQITTKYVGGRESSLFLDKASIKAIIINEGITMHRVVFYMAFIVEGRDKMVVAFEHLKPPLDVLTKIYRGARAAVLGEVDLAGAMPHANGFGEGMHMHMDMGMPPAWTG